MNARGGPVLIVDDEPIVREAIKDWLVDAGYEVAIAESGEEALEIIARRDFGVMVVDLRLPGMTGLKVLKEVKAIKPSIKSIVITAYPTPATAAEAERLGAVNYLVKPVAPDELENLIKEALAKAGKETMGK